MFPVACDPSFRVQKGNIEWVNMATIDKADRLYFKALALSRRTNFWILPVEVLGNSSMMAICLGALKWASLVRQNAINSSGVAVIPGLRVT